MADIFIHNRSHKLYKLLHVAEHSETHEKLAVYCSADGSSPIIWARPVENFMEEVDVDGKGTLKPRFELYEESQS